MSNFDFLKDFDDTLWKLGNRIERQVNTSPSGVKADATTFLEHILKRLLAMAGLKYNSRKPFTDQVDAVFRSELKMSNAYRERIKNAYNYRNKIHDEFDDIEKHEFEDAVQLHEKLFYIARKYYRDYNEDYDRYKAVPDFKPLELDFSDDEVEQVKIPDFNRIVDVSYDYCVMCGEPNHSNYSIYCHKCSRVIDNANHFISIRNTFGKDAKFTKDDLYELNIPEGYANRFLNDLIVEDMIRVSGRFYTFNNLHFDDYLSKIDKYLAVGELITKFREDKISPAEIKETLEYRQGKTGHELFYQFYKIVNREIIKKFEKDLLTTEDIWKSISYTTITQKHLQRWYNIQLGHWQRGNINESFVVFNQLLIKEYLKLKSEGILEAEIRKTLNVSDEVYDFWCEFDRYFERNLKQIKLDLITEGISRHMTRQQIIEYAGVTAKEYDDIFKVADRKGEEISLIRNEEIESRKREFVKYLLNFDLKIACRKALFTLDDFYEYYDSADVESEFYVKSTRILMDKYLTQRRFGKTKAEAIERVGIKEIYLDRWLKRSAYADFKDEDLKVTVELILKGFKQSRPIDEIAETAGVSVNAIKSYIKLGERGSGIYAPLYEYYESRIIPEKLDKFLKSYETKPMRKAMEIADLSEDELDKYYDLGKSGDERFKDFYREFLDIKKATYLYHKERGKTHRIAMKESYLTQEEYDESKDELDDAISQIRRSIVIEEIQNGRTSAVAANKANVTVEEIYDWYFKGKNGDEEYVEFYEAFHAGYVRPAINAIQESMDNNKSHLDFMIRHNKDKFTKTDVDIWVESGLLDNKVLVMLENNEDKDKENKSDFNSNEMLREMGVKDYDKIQTRKSSNSSTILRDDYDEEELKRQIMKKG